MSAATGTVPRPETTPGPQHPARKRTLAGTGTLYRFALRRDRVRLPVWILALFLGTLSTASNFKQVYADDEARASAAKTMDSPAGLAMTGPGHYLDDYNYGAMLGHQMLGFVVIMVGLMSVLAVVRHTRNEEETGRAELVRSGVVGRHASLTAALGVACTANLVLGILLAVGLPALGMDGITSGGAVLYGAAHAAVGLVFAAVAAITVQLTAHARAASGAALAVLGAAYVLRAAGDVGNGALSWLSPIGWAQRTYPFVDDRWWPLLLAPAFAFAAGAAAYVLSTRRDVGAGLRPPRPGRAAAKGFLTRPLGFALRLHRGLLTGFTVALLLLGAMYGSILGDVEDMLKNVDAIQEALKNAGGSTLAESFASTVMIVLAVVASIYVVMATLRPRAEETAGRAEPLLATALSRRRWVGSHLLVALAGGTGILLAGGLGFGLTGAASTGDSALVGRLTGAALAYAPALWVTAGVAVLLFGWLPRATALAWIVPVYGFVVGYLGKLLDFPDALNNVSPFGHVPALPAADMSWLPLLLLTAIAAALVAVGLYGFRRRDLETK
ncbi:ABC transporter permease [Streptomyces iconiensis]|uniref:ABC transporter permease n=1 Tax=Streptomyces iconiensis TaxID=1384038 RepID=A0ABT7AAK4_9ACTN|nr:ABC transporter permease [Streptomyces iconiensis]MDJ1138367.1 ABC transporter permease [Streptomyces iconiensis]